MAAVEIKTTKLAWNTFSELEAATAVSASDGALITFGADQKMIIVVTNGAASTKTVTVVAGDGIQATEDVTYTIPASGTVAIAVESGKFLLMNGLSKGKVLVKGASTDVKIQAIELP